MEEKPFLLLSLLHLSDCQVIMKDPKIPTCHFCDCPWADLHNVYSDRGEKKKAGATAGFLQLCEGK